MFTSSDCLFGFSVVLVDSYCELVCLSGSDYTLLYSEVNLMHANIYTQVQCIFLFRFHTQLSHLIMHTKLLSKQNVMNALKCRTLTELHVYDVLQVQVDGTVGVLSVTIRWQLIDEALHDHFSTKTFFKNCHDFLSECLTFFSHQRFNENQNEVAFKITREQTHTHKQIAMTLHLCLG